MQKKLIKNKYFLPVFCFLFFFSTDLSGQTDVNDLRLLKNAKQTIQQHNHRHFSKDIVLNTSKPYQTYNPVNLIFGSLMFVYQNAVSNQMGTDCIFETSCSNFSKALIAEYGVMKGIFLTADRLTRCNRMATMSVPFLYINEKTGQIIEDVNYYRPAVDYYNE